MTVEPFDFECSWERLGKELRGVDRPFVPYAPVDAKEQEIKALKELNQGLIEATNGYKRQVEELKRELDQIKNVKPFSY